MAGPCFSASLPHIPDPLLLLYIPDIAVTIPGLSVTACCTFKLPILPFTLSIPIAAILAPLGEVADALMTALRVLVKLVNDLIDKLRFSFSCPFD